MAVFRGGVHPFGGKDLSKSKPIVDLKPTREIVIPVSQHIGAPANPAVEAGDEVLVGQVIAEAGGFVSANIHASVSGKVKKVEPRMTSGGSPVMSIVIENDGEYREVPALEEPRDPEKMSAEEIRTAIRDAGIVGMGGAGFPTHVKVTPGEDSPIDRIIVNGAECEPYLTCDYRQMLETPEKLIGGLIVLLKLFPDAKGIIAIEKNKMDAVEKLIPLAAKEARMEVMPLKVKYPQGAERQLIYSVTKRKLNSSLLPAGVGCIVQNVSTVIAIYDAVVYGRPLTSRVVTVTGDAVAEPGNFRVPIGTDFRDLLEAAGGFKADPEKVIAGGPMMGPALFTVESPVTKTTSGLLCELKDQTAVDEPSPCIHCGRCVSVCPSRLVPQKMFQAAEKFDIEKFEALHGMECIECGACSYGCPAHIRLTQAFRQAKREVTARRRAAAAKK